MRRWRTAARHRGHQPEALRPRLGFRPFGPPELLLPPLLNHLPVRRNRVRDHAPDHLTPKLLPPPTSTPPQENNSADQDNDSENDGPSRTLAVVCLGRVRPWLIATARLLRRIAAAALRVRRGLRRPLLRGRSRRSAGPGRKLNPARAALVRARLSSPRRHDPEPRREAPNREGRLP